MAIDVVAFEATIREAIPVTVLEIEDISSGCGESFSVVLVSEVSVSLEQSTVLNTCPDFPREEHTGQAQNGSVIES